MDFDATMQALNMSYAKVLNETWKTFNIVSTDTKCVVPIPKSVVQIPESSFYVKRASTDLKTFIIPSLNYKLNEKEYENGIPLIVFTSGALSNWYPCSLIDNDMKFYSAEHLFMFIKATDKKYHLEGENEEKNNAKIANEILECLCPRKLQGLGRNLAMNIKKWDEASEVILKECICKKFKQNKELYEFLKIIYDIKGKIIEGKMDFKYGCGLDFDHTNPDHLDAINWTGNMKLTTIYDDVMNEIFNSSTKDIIKRSRINEEVIDENINQLTKIQRVNTVN